MQTLLTLLGRIGRSRCFQPTVKFLLYQGRVFEQSNYFVPNDRIEQILPDEAAVIANRAAQFAPAIRANTFVVVDLACGGARRCARKGVAALLTADQPLYDARLDGATARSYLVVALYLTCRQRRFAVLNL